MDIGGRTNGSAPLCVIGIAVAIVAAAVIALSCQFAAVFLLWGLVAVTGCRCLVDWLRRHDRGGTADELDALLRRPHL